MYLEFIYENNIGNLLTQIIQNQNGTQCLKTLHFVPDFKLIYGEGKE